jgi:NAD(P)-dependent dehydrogenase (short-subunit alcohol dehydrogenase family)
VERFLEEGATVVMADVAVAQGEAETKRLAAMGKPVSFAALDVTSPEQWESAVAKVVSSFGGLHVLVNNAGIADIRNIEEETLAGFRKTLAVNLDGVFLGTQRAIAQMKNNGGGSIINMASIEGLIGDPSLPAYNASKGGVRLFTRSAATHCARAGYAIRVNCICPGFIETPIHGKAAEGAKASDLSRLQDYLSTRIPAGRFGTAADIANACLYLASDESSYVMGTDIVVDGGYVAQ